MGVGVYDSDFNGTGGTFLVDGIFASEEDYADYRRECLKELRKENGPAGALELMGLDDEEDDDLSIMDYQTWSQEQYDDYNEILLDTVAMIGKELGFPSSRRKRFTSDDASFDSNFSSLSCGNTVEIGWRSWEHDFVIGVGGSGSLGELLQDVDGNTEEIVNDTGMAPQNVADTYANLVSAVEEYVRIRLMQNNFKCRFKTSGYTTGGYVLPDNVQARVEELKATIADLDGKLSRRPAEAIQEASKAERIALAEALRKINDDHGRDGDDMAEILTAIPVYNAEDGTILIADPYEEPGWVASIMAPTSGIHEYLKTLETDGDNLAPIPRNEATEAWFVAEQARRDNRLLLTAEEYMAAVGEDLVVKSVDEDDEPIEYVVARHQPAPQAPAFR